MCMRDLFFGCISLSYRQQLLLLLLWLLLLLLFGVTTPMLQGTPATAALCSDPICTNQSQMSYA